MNIPIYRALSKESKKEVFGFLVGVDYESSLCTIRTENDILGGELCFLESLCIHFPEMIDENNKNIFASLNSNGGYGDIDETYYENPFEFIFCVQEMIPYWSSFSSFKINK